MKHIPVFGTWYLVLWYRLAAHFLISHDSRSRVTSEEIDLYTVLQYDGTPVTETALYAVSLVQSSNFKRFYWYLYASLIHQYSYSALQRTVMLQCVLLPWWFLKCTVVCCLLSVVCCLLSVVCCLLSVVCCLLSVVCSGFKMSVKCEIQQYSKCKN